MADTRRVQYGDEPSQLGKSVDQCWQRASEALALARALARLVDFPMFLPGVPPDGAMMARVVMVRPITLPAGLTDSRACALVAATAETVLTLRKNGVAIGTITFAAAGTVGVFAFADPVQFAVGDVLEIVNQAGHDATLADISVTLTGTKQVIV